MSAGRLDFTLGLETAGAMANLAAFARHLAGMAFAAVGVGSAFAAMESAISKGGALFDLSRRTGASVQTLYQMQFALKQIGESADGAALLLSKMQRIAGSAEGRDKLRALGLGASAGIGDVAAALGRLNPNAQAAAAFDLFGREGAQTMLAIARSAQDFRDAMGDAAADSEVWAKNAERFDAFGDKIEALKEHVGTFFAEVAGGIYDLVAVATAAINEGRYFELLAAGFAGAFDYIANLWEATVWGMAAALDEWLAGVSAKFKILGAVIGAMPGGAVLGSTIGAVGKVDWAGGAKLGRTLQDAALARTSSAFDPFKALWKEFLPDRAVAGRRGGGGADYTPKSEKESKRPEVSDLEKMGFVFDSGSNPVVDFTRRTAQATERTAKAVEKLATNRGGAGLVND